MYSYNYPFGRIPIRLNVKLGHMYRVLATICASIRCLTDADTMGG